MSRIPGRINIRYQNVQHWTDEKDAALINHLTNTDPDIILIASTSKQTHHKPIKIYKYHTFTTNKSNERSAGCAIAIKQGLQFEIINNFQSDCIAAKIQTSHGPVIISTAYSPPRQIVLPLQDINHLARNQIPAILIADLNARHHTFGYARRTSNPKGNQLYNEIYNNRINHIGPIFNTFFTRNSATKPDIILTNNRFFFNYHIPPGGMGTSDHLTMDVQISAKPIIKKKDAYEDIDNTD